VDFKLISELSTTYGGRAQLCRKPVLENSVSQTEFWSEEPAYHDVRQNGDVIDKRNRRAASRPVESIGLAYIVLLI